MDEVIGGDSDEMSEGFDMGDTGYNIIKNHFFKILPRNDEDKFAKQIMYTKIEEKDWKIECGRALSHLKVRTRRGGKEWRNHIEKTKKYLRDIKKIMP